MDDCLLMDGYNDCLIGTVERAGMTPIACYDKDKVIARLRADGMTQVEALEFFEFNQLGAWMGPNTPCFLTLEKTTKKQS